MPVTNETTELPPESLPLLRGMTPAARKRLLRKAVSQSVATGTVLFEQGELPTFQHIVQAGSAHLFARSSEGREVLIEIVRPGDLVIPAAVVMASPYLMQARVLEPSRFLLIQADSLRAAMAAEPTLAREMVTGLAGQFRRMVRQIKNLKLRSSTERVGSYILALSRTQKNHNRVVLPYEKHLIASELGMTRENFSRTLSALQKHGIRVKGSMVFITDAKRLVAVSDPDPLIDG